MDDMSQTPKRAFSPALATGVIVVIVALIIIGIVYYLQAQGNSSSNYSNTTPTVTPTQTTSGAAATTVPTNPLSQQADAVTIQNFAFSPASLTIKAGQTVTWTNKDNTTHQIQFADGTKSSPLNNGDTYTRTFNSAGTYSYICAIHTEMTGKIVVQ